MVERFSRDPARLEAVSWPAELAPIRVELEKARETSRSGAQPARVLPTFASIPALLIPRIEQLQDRGDGRIVSAAPLNGYTVAVLDRGYLEKDLLPQLVERHFRLSQDPSLYVGIYGPGIAFSAPGGQVPAALRTAADVTDDDMFESASSSSGASSPIAGWSRRRDRRRDRRRSPPRRHRPGRAFASAPRRPGRTP